MIKIQGKKRKDLSIITICVWIWAPCSGCMLKWLGHSRGRASLGCPLSTWLTDFLSKLVALGSSPRLRCQWQVMTAVSLVTYWTENHFWATLSLISRQSWDTGTSTGCEIVSRRGLCHTGSSVPRLANSTVIMTYCTDLNDPGLIVDTALTHTTSWLSA